LILKKTDRQIPPIEEMIRYVVQAGYEVKRSTGLENSISAFDFIVFHRKQQEPNINEGQNNGF